MEISIPPLPTPLETPWNLPLSPLLRQQHPEERHPPPRLASPHRASSHPPTMHRRLLRILLPPHARLPGLVHTLSHLRSSSLPTSFLSHLLQRVTPRLVRQHRGPWT